MKGAGLLLLTFLIEVLLPSSFVFSLAYGTHMTDIVTTANTLQTSTSMVAVGSRYVKKKAHMTELFGLALAVACTPSSPL